MEVLQIVELLKPLQKEIKYQLHLVYQLLVQKILLLQMLELYLQMLNQKMEKLYQLQLNFGVYDQYNTGADEYSLINSEYTNNGTIKAVANGKENSEAIGLVADQVIEDSRIINNGTISVTASGAGATAEAITFKDVIKSGKIVNTKTIEAFLINPSLENDDATGIYTDKFENSEIKIVEQLLQMLTQI